MSKNENHINLVHALILTKIYNALKDNGEAINIDLEDGNKEHAETINYLVDEGLINVMPNKNRLMIHLTDKGLNLMQSVEGFDQNIPNQDI